MRLGCAEFCIPGELEEKLRLCREHGLWLELANTGERDLSPLDTWDVEVRTVQAFLLHHSSLGARGGESKNAEEHVRRTVDMASEVGAAYALIVPGYGYGRPEGAEERLAESMRRLAEYAQERDVAILMEALSPRKTDLLPSMAAVQGFLERLGMENLALAADTCHAHEAGEDVLDYRELIHELHLKDTSGAPPGEGELDFKRILEKPWRQLCIEYRGEGDVERVLDFLRSLGRPLL
jgi:sugar phosphate isomerase/epimerase